MMDDYKDKKAKKKSKKDQVLEDLAGGAYIERLRIFPFPAKCSLVWPGKDGTLDVKEPLTEGLVAKLAFGGHVLPKPMDVNWDEVRFYLPDKGAA